MLLEAERAQGAERVHFGDFARRTAGQESDQERDQPAHDQGVAVAAKAHQRDAMAVAVTLCDDPHLAGTALDLVFGRTVAVGKVAESTAKLDQEAVTVLPIIEEGE